MKLQYTLKIANVKDFQTIHRRCVKLTYVDPFVNNGEDVTIYNFHLPSDYSNNNSVLDGDKDV